MTAVSVPEDAFSAVPAEAVILPPPRSNLSPGDRAGELLLREKTNCRKYIAYFQAYTNTYAPVGVLRALYTEALAQPDIVALSIATRCDCLPPDVLDLLAELNTIKPVWVELGLQTIHGTHSAFYTQWFFTRPV